VAATAVKAKPTKGNTKPAHRPPKWTDAEKAKLKDRVCDLVAAGETDATIEMVEGMPSAQSIRRWRIEDEVFCSNYARAREARADFRADRIDGYVSKVVDGTLDPNAARVAIDAEKWQAGKEKPKVYGDRLQLDADVTMSMTDDQLDRRLAQLLGKTGALPATRGTGTPEETA
jgi:hypothetical protein